MGQKFLKETINKMKRQTTEWEKIFANYTTSEGLISKIHKQLIQPQYQKKKKKIQLKIMGRRPEYTFFQRRHADGKRAHDKMLKHC